MLIIRGLSSIDTGQPMDGISSIICHHSDIGQTIGDHIRISTGGCSDGDEVLVVRMCRSWYQWRWNPDLETAETLINSHVPLGERVSRRGWREDRTFCHGRPRWCGHVEAESSPESIETEIAQRSLPRVATA